MGCTVARDQPAGSAPYIGHTPLEERVVMTVSQKVNFYFSDPNPDLDRAESYRYRYTDR